MYQTPPNKSLKQTGRAGATIRRFVFSQRLSGQHGFFSRSLPAA